VTAAFSLVYDDYHPDREGLRETLCTLGNGRFCTRGAAADAAADGVHYPGTYVAGGYNRLTTEVEGHEIENEDLVNMPNWLVLAIRIEDGPVVHPDRVQILSYRQELMLDQGLLVRTIRFRDAAGRTTRWEERRLVSMADPHLAAISLTLVAEDWSGTLSVRSGLDGSVINAGVDRYRALKGRHLETLDKGSQGDIIHLASRTVQSHLVVAEAARTRIYRGGAPIEPDRLCDAEDDSITHELTLALHGGDSVEVEKVVALVTSRDPAISEPALTAQERAAGAGRFEDLLDDHRTAWEHLWHSFGLEIESDNSADDNLKLRLHIFHLLQTVSRHSTDADAGVPPRGWHGEAYRGHIMWDEIFIFPFLALRDPRLTRALLRYRYRRLPAARRLARATGQAGAMYPWMSGSDGREETQVLHLNPRSGRWVPDTSNRQRHINSAVAFNVWKYFEVSDDLDFLHEHGAEMLVEIARFWAGLATYNPERGRYDIRGVMGPDEFHTGYPGSEPGKETGLDNNAYTNVLAAWVLNRACDALQLLRPDRSHTLREELRLGDDEPKLWDDISRKLCVPFHKDGIISQFEGYEALEEFDWEGYRARYGDLQRLDRILEAEGDSPNRYKVSKQADVLMLFYLFSADELMQLFDQLGYAFTRDMIPATVDYYAQRTSHGSTLSWVVHSWVIARADRLRSWQLFQGALSSDFDDIQGGTTSEGIHLGAMAGTVDIVQRGYTGIETRGKVLHFNPFLPMQLHRLVTRVCFRRQVLDIEVTHDRLTVARRNDGTLPITIAYRGSYRELYPGGSTEFRLVSWKEPVGDASAS